MGKFHPWRIPSEIVFRLFYIKIVADVRKNLDRLNILKSKISDWKSLRWV